MRILNDGNYLKWGLRKNIWLNFLRCLLSTKDYNQSCVENVDGECLWESYRIGRKKNPSTPISSQNKFLWTLLGKPGKGQNKQLFFFLGGVEYPETPQIISHFKKSNDYSKSQSILDHPGKTWKTTAYTIGCWGVEYSTTPQTISSINETNQKPKYPDPDHPKQASKSKSQSILDHPG